MNYQNDEKNLKTFSRLANEFYNVNISSGNSLLESNNINNILYTNSRNSYLSLLKIKKTSINTQPASDQFNFISNKDISSSFFLNDLSSFKIKSTNNKNNNLLNNILLSSIENNNFNYTGRNFVDLVESSR
jgi:hypothetical protein